MTSMVLGAETTSPRYRIEKVLDIAEVPSDFRVGFCLLTAGDMQYVAYYDKERRMTVASRTLDSDTWAYQILPTKIGFDSHNYVTMAVDGDGHLHVSGNMHCVPLIYFRTETAGDISTLKPLAMTGEKEERVTYPGFLTDQSGKLLFKYRDGRSGNGVWIWNRYDPATRTWSRLMDRPLLEGEGERSAYPASPVRGPDGWFHLLWVWRDTPDCATNHHLSYGRSKDFVHWESVFGKQVQLPLTLGEMALWVDPVPSGGGIINGCEKLFFDARNRPVITYHKRDAKGAMQVYAARPEGTEWKRYVLTDWTEPVMFAGRGSMGGDTGIGISGLSRVEAGVLTMTYSHRDRGRGRLVIDEETLRPLSRTIHIVPEYPAALTRVESTFEGMGARRCGDLGGTGDESTRYVIKWETLPPNHDRPRQPPLPAPSMLRLYQLSADK